MALPLSAGVTVYVAATDLLPEVNREPGWRAAALVFVGGSDIVDSTGFSQSVNSPRFASFFPRLATF